MNQQRAKDLLSYNEDTGEFIWKIKQGYMLPGTPAGGIHPSGYIFIGIDRKRYAAHRLAWLWVYGEFPKLGIDHINGVKTDNRIANLRAVSCRENQNNQYKHRGGRLVGARFRGKSWESYITIERKYTYIGSFPTQEEAHAAYTQERARIEG